VRDRIAINGSRLIADLRTLAEFGRTANGIDRTAFSPADGEARRWLREAFAAAGLDAGIDAIGNVYGRCPQRRAILIASHSDTVATGGWLDGALGVCYALEIARSFRIDPDGPIGVDAIAFQDEEGAFLPCLGSTSFCGEPLDTSALRSRTGETFGAASARARFGDAAFRLNRNRHVAFIEPHIEQGPLLELEGRRLGIVDGIVGVRRFSVQSTGRADHAGTTPMAVRADAALPLFRLALWLHRSIGRIGSERSVCNVGAFAVRPGAVNVVPAAAELTLEFRDVDRAVLTRIEAALDAELGRLRRTSRATLTATCTAALDPAPMHAGLSAMLRQACNALGHPPLDLPSGAFHDALVMCRHVPTAMLFIPSRGGRSHTSEEDTAEDDIVLGCEALAEAVSRLINSGGLPE